MNAGGIQSREVMSKLSSRSSNASPFTSYSPSYERARSARDRGDTPLTPRRGFPEATLVPGSNLIPSFRVGRTALAFRKPRPEVRFRNALPAHAMIAFASQLTLAALVLEWSPRT